MKNDTDTAALLPCPFCGGEAEMREWDFPYVRYQSRCVACKTTGRTRFNERAKAIAAWNRRATTPPTDDEREGLARAMQELMGPLVGSPEYLADPVKRARAEARWTEAAMMYATTALAYLAPIRAREIAAAEARERDELRAALAPFAELVPSSLYSEDGSEGEKYIFLLHDQSTVNQSAIAGADIARARALAPPQPR